MRAAMNPSNSCLEATWWYSALGWTSNSPANRRIEKNSRPQESSSLSAAVTTSSRLFPTGRILWDNLNAVHLNTIHLRDEP